MQEGRFGIRVKVRQCRNVTYLLVGTRVRVKARVRVRRILNGPIWGLGLGIGFRVRDRV